MANEQPITRVAVDDVVDAAARGVLRALDVRKVSAPELISSGFFVDIVIRAGGMPGALRALSALNLQPLPPQEIK